MSLLLGLNHSLNPEDPTHQQPLHLSDAARRLGTYVIGTTGTGKSTFLQSMILQDIRAGHGVCVLDPHGDLIDDVLPCISEHRKNDVILFDPNTIEQPFGLNLFSCDRADPRQRNLVTSGLMDTLYKLFYTSWGPRMEDLLRHSIQTLLYVPDSTFLELLLLLTDHEHRARLKAPACEKDPILRHYWEQQFPESYPEIVKEKPTGKWKNPPRQVELVGSSLNKIGRFLVNPVIRNIIAQPQSTINFRQAMDEGHIILINLSKGDLGTDNSSFLGSVLVNQILLAALTRRDTPQRERRLFHLYVDEYQDFATESFPQLQSEARKFAVTTTVAHQYRDQLDENNQGSSLNVANLIVFRVSGKDALELSSQFDNTPREYPAQYRRVMVPVAEGIFVPGETGGSQAALYQELSPMSEPYSDVRMETANILAMLRQYQAVVRIVDEQKKLQQYRMDTVLFSEYFDCDPENRTAQAIANHIRRCSWDMGTPVEEVEADIERRVASDVEYLSPDTYPNIPFTTTLSNQEG